MNRMKQLATYGITDNLTGCNAAIKTDLFTDDERLEFLTMLADGICTGCGRVLGFREVCHCENDE